jgi:hypothetical protein
MTKKLKHGSAPDGQAGAGNRNSLTAGLRGPLRMRD